MLNQYPFIKIQERSFSAYTFSVRYPSILRKIISAQLFDDRIQSELNQLHDDLSYLKVTRLKTTPDNNIWGAFYQYYENLRLLEVPFFYAEVYFFAIIRDVTRYNDLKIDPFDVIKKIDFDENIHLLSSTIKDSLNWESKDFILFSLQGNKSDLSQINQGFNFELDLLIDHTEALISHAESNKSCHIIQDNCGIELFSDLLLANHLVEKYGTRIFLHLKSEPIFVSDSLLKDLDKLLERLDNHPLGKVLRNKIDGGNIVIETSDYWSSPVDFNGIVEEIGAQEGSMIISKGDANYRRFFSDKQLEPSFNSENLTSYLKVPVFCIRTLKSEIQTDIPIRTVRYLNSKTPDWMSNGSYAVIQCINVKTST